MIILMLKFSGINESEKWINEPEAAQVVPNSKGEGEFDSLIVL